MKLTMLALLALGLISNAAYAQNCSDIRPKICTLKPFEPNPGLGGGTDAASSPVCDVDSTNLPDQKTTIQFAYDLAPSKVKTDLCNITNLYVIQSGIQHSWGRWEDPAIHHQIPSKTQIALHPDDLNKTFSDKQDDNFSALTILSTVHASHSEANLPQRIAPKALGLLYVLAHE